ncbi:MAG: hypothetical protein JKX85_08005 [Phycisphaeraceae bacterium]|nr:hypothetical protein [Phycisphaeraceae bacterium]
MNQSELMNVVVILISIGGIAWIAYGPLQDLVEDWVRQRIFDARADLFDIADEGRLAFDDFAYLEMRAGMNRMIRFAHEMTWVRFFVYMMLLPLPERAGRISIAIDSVEDENLREELAVLRRQIAEAVAMGMVFRSPALMLIVFPPVFLAVVGTRVGKEVLRLVGLLGWWRIQSRKMFQTLDKEACSFEGYRRGGAMAKAYGV